MPKGRAGSMPSSAATASGSPRARSGAAATIRWDRIVRWALRAAIVVLLLLLLKAGVEIAVTSFQRSDTDEALRALQAENSSLKQRRSSLTGEGGVEIEARRLGMVKPGEVPVVVTGLPGDRR